MQFFDFGYSSRMSTIITITDLDEVAQKILAIAVENKKENRATIIALSGDLGAGKTTLVQTIAKLVGISDSLQSPTFVILKNYETKHVFFKNLIHVDAYRLDSKEELLKINWQNYAANPDNLICIEWPEQVDGLLPDDTLCVLLEHVSEQERRINIKR